MTILTIKIAVEILCAVCKLIGELWWHNAQRFIMPVILGIGISIQTHLWWLGLTVLMAIGPICLGYKDFGPSDGFDRGMWLFLIIMSAGLGCLLTGHLAWYLYAPWCIVGGIWGATTRRLLNIVIAPITGLLIGALIWFVH